jgi:hypothetical protein
MAGAASNGIYWVKYSQGNPGNAAHKHVRSFAFLLKQRAIRLFKEDSSSSLSLSPRLKSHSNLFRAERYYRVAAAGEVSEIVVRNVKLNS